MKMIRRNNPGNRQRQKGLTLIELLVAGIISLIAASGMVIVMANTLGTGAQTIKMSRLSQEMRTAMQIMSRELRRANYHATFLSCYGNLDCLTDLSLTAKVGEINIINSGDNDCFWFWYDRPGSASVLVSKVAAFRRKVENGVGRIQMVTDLERAPDCSPDPSADADWQYPLGADLTDPAIIDVLTFNVSDAASVTEIINASNDTQLVERIGLSMTAKLKDDASVATWIRGNANASRELVEFVKVRNNTTALFAAP